MPAHLPSHSRGRSDALQGAAAYLLQYSHAAGRYLKLRQEGNTSEWLLTAAGHPISLMIGLKEPKAFKKIQLGVYQYF
jgi:hypothetical protein